MPRRPKAEGPSKSDSIRELLKADPSIKVKDAIAKLAAQGISVTGNLVYLIKGKMKGAKAMKRKYTRRAAKAASAVSVATNPIMDPVKAITKVRTLASELGGLSNLRAVVDALHG